MLTLLKELINVENIKKNASAVFIAFAMLIAGYFVNEWTGSQKDCDIRVDNIQRQKDSISGKYFDLLLKMYEKDRLIEKQHQVMVQTDSVIRQETKKDAEQIIKQNK